MKCVNENCNNEVTERGKILCTSCIEEKQNEILNKKMNHNEQLMNTIRTLQKEKVDLQNQYEEKLKEIFRNNKNYLDIFYFNFS